METHNGYAERIAEVFLNGKWVANTNYQSILSDITLDEAVVQVKGLNSIYQLVFHVNYYVEGLCRVYSLGKLDISDKFSFPESIPRTEEDWESIKVDLQLNARNLVSLVNRLANPDFEAPFIFPQYGDNARNFNGLIEHAYYHLGQISLIKKMLRTDKL